MNRGLQDAFNLAWKLALVCKGADPMLLDSYEIERRPAADMVGRSGDNAEHNLTMTGSVERSSRNQSILEMLAETKARHHEIAAETELNVDYAISPIVMGDGSTVFDECNGGIAAGHRIPDTILVHPSGRPPCRLVELTHRLDHTLLLLAGPEASGLELVELDATLQEFATDPYLDPPLFDAAFTLAAQSGLPAPIGQLGHVEANLLGVTAITLFAIRPDGHVGLRSDSDHLRALKRYRGLILEGKCELAFAADE
jgi:hypothetical protein